MPFADDVARPLAGGASPEPFRGNGHVRLAARRNARQRVSALPRLRHVHVIGAVETAGDDRTRSAGRAAERADGIDVIVPRATPV
jgi:hypothetical protein